MERALRELERERAAPSSREKILEVAEALFAQRGFTGVGLRAVADAAGLGKSSLFHHFRSKTQLYFEVLGLVLGRIRERLEPLLAARLAPERKLERWVEGLVDVLAEHPTTARLLLRGLFEEDSWPPDAGAEQLAAEATLQELLDGAQQLLREGVECGAFRRVSVPHTLQTLIGATVYHFASGELGDGLLGRPLFSADEVRRRKRELTALLRQGLLAPAADPGGD